MEHSGCFDEHDLYPLLETLETDVKERPVPVVVVKGTELRPALVQLVPQHAGERHPHVVLGTNPRG